jgi:F420-0:gamma-glutamyl ligase
MRKPARTELSLTQKALAAMQDAVAKVIEDHRRRGRPVAIGRDGKVAWLTPEECSRVSESEEHYACGTPSNDP